MKGTTIILLFYAQLVCGSWNEYLIKVMFGTPTSANVTVLSKDSWDSISDDYINTMKWKTFCEMEPLNSTYPNIYWKRVNYNEQSTLTNDSLLAADGSVPTRKCGGSWYDSSFDYITEEYKNSMQWKTSCQKEKLNATYPHIYWEPVNNLSSTSEQCKLSNSSLLTADETVPVRNCSRSLYGTSWDSISDDYINTMKWKTFCEMEPLNSTYPDIFWKRVSYNEQSTLTNDSLLDANGSVPVRNCSGSWYDSSFDYITEEYKNSMQWKTFFNDEEANDLLSEFNENQTTTNSEEVQTIEERLIHLTKLLNILVLKEDLMDKKMDNIQKLLVSSQCEGKEFLDSSEVPVDSNADLEILDKKLEVNRSEVSE